MYIEKYKRTDQSEREREKEGNSLAVKVFTASSTNKQLIDFYMNRSLDLVCKKNKNWSFCSLEDHADR